MKLHAVTAYFNPMGYQTRRDNYELFAAGLRTNEVDLLTIECVLNKQSSELSDLNSGDVITVQVEDMLWHKERLLNLAIQHLPDDIDAVAWIDCDVIFADGSWRDEAVRLLDDFHVVQLFSAYTHLPPGEIEADTDAVWLPSFGAKLAESPSSIGTRFAEHGHTGFAWAIRKPSIADTGLFDVCIAGGADHLMAHAFCGDWNVPCVDRLLGRHSPLRTQFDSWSEHLNHVIDGRIGACQGRVMHLWHGSLRDRRYFGRNDRLLKMGFDPARDLKYGPDGCWALTDRNSAVAQFLNDYLSGRKEDG